MGVQVASDDSSKKNLQLPGSGSIPENLPHPCAPPSRQDRNVVKRNSNLKKSLCGITFGMLFIGLIAAVIVLAVKFNYSQHTLKRCRMNQQMSGRLWNTINDDQYDSEMVPDFITDLNDCIDFSNPNVEWRCLKRMIRSRLEGNNWFGDSDDDLVEE